MKSPFKFQIGVLGAPLKGLIDECFDDIINGFTCSLDHMLPPAIVPFAVLEQNPWSIPPPPPPPR